MVLKCGAQRVFSVSRKQKNLGKKRHSDPDPDPDPAFWLLCVSWSFIACEKIASEILNPLHLKMDLSESDKWWTFWYVSDYFVQNKSRIRQQNNEETRISCLFKYLLGNLACMYYHNLLVFENPFT